MDAPTRNILLKEISTLRKAAESTLQRLGNLEEMLGSDTNASKPSRRRTLRSYFEQNDLTGTVKKPTELKTDKRK